MVVLTMRGQHHVPGVVPLEGVGPGVLPAHHVAVVCPGALEPIGYQNSCHVINLDQSEASIKVA